MINICDVMGNYSVHDGLYGVLIYKINMEHKLNRMRGEKKHDAHTNPYKNNYFPVSVLSFCNVVTKDFAL